MNPKAHSTILRQSRIFGYIGAVLSIPFALAGGLIASCCPFGVLVGAVPLLATSGLGAVLAAIFMDYSVVSKKQSTGAGLRVGMRTAAIAALGGGIFTLFTASQSLSLMSAAAASQSPPTDGGVAAAFTIGISNLFMLLVVVALCLPGGILWGVIGAAIRGSAALDQEPPLEPGWEAEVKKLKKGSLIEWTVLLGLLAAVSLVIPMIQQHSIAKSPPERSSPMTVNMPAATTSGMPRTNPPQASLPAYKPPFSASPGGKYSVEIFEDSQQGRLILVKEHGEHLFEQQAMGYLQDVHWSPGGQFVAINERRGNSGDYLWILDLKQQRVFKRPDDTIWKEIESKCIPIVREKAAKKWGAGVQDDRDWGTASGWEDENTLLVTFTVRFLGSAIEVGEDSRLEVVSKLRVATDGVFIQKETQRASRKIGEGLLVPSCGLDFMEDTGTLIATFEWYARYGAERMTVNIKDLELDSVKIGNLQERGAFEGGVPVEIPFKPNAAAKRERWSAGASDFSWSMPPNSLVATEGMLNTVALSQDKAAALVSALKALRPRTESRLINPNSPNVETPSSRLSVQPAKEQSSRPDPQPSPELLVFSNALKSVWSGGALPVNSLGGLSPWELRILRNAIFARHGRKFESGKLSGFFHGYPGYNEDGAYTDSRITSTDRANVEAVKAAELLAKKPMTDTAWNALRNFLDALAAGDVDSAASLIHSTKPVERAMLTLDEPPKIANQEKFYGNSKRLKELCLDDGGNGEGYSFMMSALWDFTLSAQHAGNGMFRNKESSMEIGFTEISGKWWLTRVVETVP